MGSVEPGASAPPPVRIALWTLMAATLVVILLLALASWLRHRPAGRQALPDLGEVPPFELTGSDGEPVRRGDLTGAPYVVDFVFTRCVTSCPVMTGRMKTVGEGLVEGRDFRRVSISVDPAHDTPEVLREFRETRGLPDSWWFLTGEPEPILALIRDGFHLAIEPDTGNPVDPIAHSTRFVLVDGGHRVRGYYDGLDLEAVARLDRDLRRLVRGAAQALRTAHLVQQLVHGPVELRDAEDAIHRMLGLPALAKDDLAFPELELHGRTRGKPEASSYLHGNGDLTLGRDGALHEVKRRALYLLGQELHSSVPGPRTAGAGRGTDRTAVPGEAATGCHAPP